MITIRAEKPEDISAIRIVNERAFGRPEEGEIVDRLRESCPDFLSLVAEADGGIVGAILFTPAVIEGVGRRIAGMLLGPLAALPERQRHGIGSALTRRGLDLLGERGCPFVVLVGHPEYYPRFGFEHASALGLTCPWDGVPLHISGWPSAGRSRSCIRPAGAPRHRCRRRHPTDGRPRADRRRCRRTGQHPGPGCPTRGRHSGWGRRAGPVR